jgi:hypothetical protein
MSSISTQDSEEAFPPRNQTQTTDKERITFVPMTTAHLRQDLAHLGQEVAHLGHTKPSAEWMRCNTSSNLFPAYFAPNQVRSHSSFSSFANGHHGSTAWLSPPIRQTSHAPFLNHPESRSSKVRSLLPTLLADRPSVQTQTQTQASGKTGARGSVDAMKKAPRLRAFSQQRMSTSSYVERQKMTRSEALWRQQGLCATRTFDLRRASL